MNNQLNFLWLMGGLMIRVLALLVLLASVGLSDNWLPATTKSYVSRNGEYLIRVHPAKYDDGANKVCIARIYKYSVKNDKYEFFETLNLKNRWAPLEVLISDDCKYLITLNEHGGNTHSNNIIVVYNLFENKVQQFSLKDFLTTEDLEYIPRSVSSTYWNGEAYLNKDFLYILGPTELGYQTTSAKFKKIISYELNLNSMEFEILRTKE